MTGAKAILEIVDSAPVFVDVVEDPPAIAEAIRKFGRAELDAAIALVKAAEGDARQLMLSAGAQRLGQVIASGALHEGFARVSLEDAAGICGLIRDDGLRAVKKAIADGIKLGKKLPRDLSDVAGEHRQIPERKHETRFRPLSKRGAPSRQYLPTSILMKSTAATPTSSGAVRRSSSMSNRMARSMTACV